MSRGRRTHSLLVALLLAGGACADGDDKGRPGEKKASGTDESVAEGAQSGEEDEALVPVPMAVMKQRALAAVSRALPVEASKVVIDSGATASAAGFDHAGSSFSKHVARLAALQDSLFGDGGVLTDVKVVLAPGGKRVFSFPASASVPWKDRAIRFLEVRREGKVSDPEPFEVRGYCSVAAASSVSLCVSFKWGVEIDDKGANHPRMTIRFEDELMQEDGAADAKARWIVEFSHRMRPPERVFGRYGVSPVPRGSVDRILFDASLLEAGGIALRTVWLYGAAIEGVFDGKRPRVGEALAYRMLKPSSDPVFGAEAAYLPLGDVEAFWGAPVAAVFDSNNPTAFARGAREALLRDPILSGGSCATQAQALIAAAGDLSQADKDRVSSRYVCASALSAEAPDHDASFDAIIDAVCRRSRDFRIGPFGVSLCDAQTKLLSMGSPFARVPDAGGYRGVVGRDLPEVAAALVARLRELPYSLPAELVAQRNVELEPSRPEPVARFGTPPPPTGAAAR